MKRVKEEGREASRRGISYGIVKYLGGEEVGEVREGEVVFNYLGRIDEVGEEGEEMREIRMARESGGAERDEELERRQALEVMGVVAGGRLKMSIAYSGEKYEEESIRELMER